MDDNGIEEEFDGGTEFRLTPKGMYMAHLIELGASKEHAEECWCKFESFCVKVAFYECPEHSHAAIVFDGDGGLVVGLDLTTEEDE